MQSILSFLIIIASLSGLLLSFYIFKKKRANEVMICPIGSDCNNVVHSDYSKFFGIPLELIGIIYYGIILTAYSLTTVFTGLSFESSTFALLLLSLAAFLFSAYLTLIQGMVLKEWCTWCLTSASLSTLIFIAGMTISDWSFISLLKYHEGIVFLIHLGGIALGVGAATIADIFFLKFIKDFNISVDESRILRTFGQIIWFALAIAFVTSLALLLPNIGTITRSPQYIVESIVLLILIANAVYLTLIVAPRLVSLSFDKERFETISQDRQKKLAFALSAISLISWYSMLFLASPIPVSFSTERLVLAYIALVIIAIGASQLIHDRIEFSAEKAGY